MLWIRLCRLQFKWRGKNRYLLHKVQYIGRLSKKSEKKSFGRIYLSFGRVRYRENILRKILKKNTGGVAVKIKSEDWVSQYHTEINYSFVSFELNSSKLSLYARWKGQWITIQTRYVHEYVLPFDVFQITGFPVKPHLHAHVNNSCVFLHSAFFLRGLF